MNPITCDKLLELVYANGDYEPYLMFSNNDPTRFAITLNLTSYQELMQIIDNLNTIHYEISRETRLSLTTQLVDYIFEYCVNRKNVIDHILKLFYYDHFKFYDDDEPFTIFDDILKKKITDSQERIKILNRLKLIYGNQYRD